jgi:hypothetical protein
MMLVYWLSASRGYPLKASQLPVISCEMIVFHSTEPVGAIVKGRLRGQNRKLPTADMSVRLRPSKPTQCSGSLGVLLLRWIRLGLRKMGAPSVSGLNPPIRSTH